MAVALLTEVLQVLVMMVQIQQRLAKLPAVVKAVQKAALKAVIVVQQPHQQVLLYILHLMVTQILVVLIKEIQVPEVQVPEVTV